MSEYPHHFHAALGDGARELTSKEINLVSGGVVGPGLADGGYGPNGRQSGPRPNPMFNVADAGHKMVSDGLSHLKY
jgi:hypothetical protein